MQFTVQPDVCAVDESIEIRVTAVLDKPLVSGESIAFAPPESWSSRPYCITFTKEPQQDDPSAPDYVQVSAEGVAFDQELKPIMLPAGTEKGHVRQLVATVREGSLDAGDTVTFWMHNYRAAWLAEPAHFRVFVNDQELPDGPTIRTLPQDAVRVRITVPSCARPGDTIPVRIVSLDKFWNLSRTTYRHAELVDQDGKVVESGIGFTGAYETTVTLGDEGVYRLRCLGALSNPVKVSENPHGPYWGDVHGHDKLHNRGAGEIPFQYARDVANLDFVCVAPDFRGLGADAWRWHVDRTNAFNEAGRFTTILSYEMGFSSGHHNVYFRDGKGWIFDVADQDYWLTDKFMSEQDPATTFMVPHHVGVHWRPQDRYYPERDNLIPLLEIYSQHGLGEEFWPEHGLSYENNRTRGLEAKHASSVDRPVWARDAWEQGRRYGVIAGSDGHMGQCGKPVKGLTAVLAPENAREALWDSMRDRHCYGSTGERIIIDFSISGQPMGSEMVAKPGDILDIDIAVHGTDELSFVELVRYDFEKAQWETVFADRTMVKDPFAEIGIVDPMDFQGRLQQSFEGDALYYLRVGQKFQLADWPVMAWSSPIWVSEE